jgi:ABC-type transport system involved in multi-copper enzyme maturation permease subunit
MTAIYLLSLRQLTGRWRVVILLGLCAVPLVLAAIAGAAADKPTPAELDDILMNGLLASAILPIVVLAVAPAALGNELTDKTLGNLTLTPIPRWRIALSKLAASITVSAPPLVAGTAGGVLLGFGLLDIGGAGKAAAAAAIAMTVGIALYSAVFLWAGLVTSHPLALGLLYVFIWEGLFATFVNGIKYLSIRQYTLGIVKVIDAGRFAGADQHVLGGSAAIVGCAVVFLGFTLLVVRRLQRMDVP